MSKQQHPGPNEENVSAQLPVTDLEAQSLQVAISDLLRAIPVVWADVDGDCLSHLQTRALFLLISSGMVERRGWLRTTIANHSTCIEIRFQATGESGYHEALQQASPTQFEVWRDAWRDWCGRSHGGASPFHSYMIKPQEWRLTDQGVLARDDLNGLNPDSDPAFVFDFVFKRGPHGPGYWLRRMGPGGRPLSEEETQTVARLQAAGQDLGTLPRPPCNGNGELLEIRKVEASAPASKVNVNNWDEGAAAFAAVFTELMGQRPEVQSPSAATVPQGEPTSPATGPKAVTPSLFAGGLMVFREDRVTLCDVDICSGARSKPRRDFLELLAQRRPDGQFPAYDKDEIAQRIKLKSGEKSVAGLVRDLREDITARLGQLANIQCDGHQVILSGGPGYRFADAITVQLAPGSAITDIEDNDQGHDVSSVPSGDVPDVPNGDVRNRNVPDVGNERQTWILKELAKGRPLNAPNVAKHFGCSVKTVQRDLNALKKAGKVEFVGTSRSGIYRLR
ncbi:HTH domain protein [Anatilimnocola aggregata]|uniref:HTH domain protein n=1 Tax=Anatilimnocola aggregata TaxID=2528021 RepID=A0A517YC81_9BACT|nr:winged helix-turn-helix domain-containing protein [Anatilimnocola aggregata]QDU27732.1 HTH domain protein [Anatilimnocola aggregata]